MHDVHQMGPRGARLFVPPYTDPWEPNVDPALRAAANAIGIARGRSPHHRRARRASSPGAIFDAWTPARAYPHTHGGVRVLSETASARLATPLDVERRRAAQPRAGATTRSSASWNFPAPWPGGTWRLGDIVEYPARGLAARCWTTPSRNREYWLRTALGVNRRACERRRAASPSSSRPRSATRSAAARLVEVLHTGGVEVHRARTRLRGRAGATSAREATSSRMQQPASAFAQTLLERQRYPDLRPDPERPAAASLRRDRPHPAPAARGARSRRSRAAFAADLEPVDVPRVAPGRVEGRGPALRPRPRERRPRGPGAAARRRRRRPAGPSSRSPKAAATSRPGTLLVPASARRRARGPGQRARDRRPRAVRARPRALRLRAPRVGLYRSWVPSMDEGWTRFVFEHEMDVRLPHPPRPRGAGGAPPGPLRRDRAPRPEGLHAPATATRRAACRRSTRAGSGRRAWRRCGTSSRTGGRSSLSTRPPRSRSSSSTCRSATRSPRWTPTSSTAPARS